MLSFGIDVTLAVMNHNLIQLNPHNPHWASVFEAESRCLQNQLKHSIVRINHVGSTSVTGIKAKPIIDILVESETYPPNQEIIASLRAMGYENRGESGVPERCWFIKGVPRKYNLHWCPVGGVVARAQIKFRDALKGNSKLACEYERIKTTAAPGQEIDSQTYADAKTEFISRVLAQ